MRAGIHGVVDVGPEEVFAQPVVDEAEDEVSLSVLGSLGSRVWG